MATKGEVDGGDGFLKSAPLNKAFLCYNKVFPTVLYNPLLHLVLFIIMATIDFVGGGVRLTPILP